MTIALLLAMALATPLAAQPAYHPPHTPDGQPNLQGDWTNESLTGLERDDYFDTLAPPEDKVAAYEKMINDPAATAAYTAERRKKAGKPPPIQIGQQESEFFGYTRLGRVGGQARSSMITDPADGALPYTKAAAAMNQAAGKRFARVFDNPEDRDVSERCLIASSSAPLSNAVSNPEFKIVQTRDAVVIAAETEHDVRVIRLTGGVRGGVVEGFGDSVGAWQGETLRVETTGFPQIYARAIGFDAMLSERARVTEWFTRTGAETILYRFQVDDPETYTRPWRGEMELVRGKGLNEYACHEGNYALAGILAGARAWERRGKTPEFLDGGDAPPKPASSEGGPAKP